MIRLIDITESDILNGEPHDCDKCAIALALRREYKTDRIDVVFKKESYGSHNLKHKRLTNKEGVSQLIESETIKRMACNSFM